MSDDDEPLIAPRDAIAWILWERLRRPDFMPKFPFTLNELKEIDPAWVERIDAAFKQSPADQAARGGARLPTVQNPTRKKG